MADDDPRLITVLIEAGVAYVTFTAPPMNIITAELFSALSHTWRTLEGDPTVRVAVFRSGDPEFFLAHVDVNMILDTDVEESTSVKLNPFQRLCARVHASAIVSIAEIAGRVGGGGSELCAACDMRFGASQHAVVNQMEVALGFIPAGGGTQFITSLIGRGRALEVILGADDIDADTAAMWGYLNRALPRDELPCFVSRLAERIARFPPDAVRLAKSSVRNAAAMPLHEGLVQESALFVEALRSPAARPAMRAFLEAGGQTRRAEMRIADLLREL
ncbi:enoyl-CoA hydratase/isomerase family protein [Mycobacterium kyogaense]|uniref:enoyl-CoA hydratase/isomerase family protein n=1 Tax=Mycobacterium kyogaense TaxID=2212479 RepID=UPI000DAEBFAB|nr:enoyl-CoA hydratase/isomerase family protein [Mycobacterium kyogaense]